MSANHDIAEPPFWDDSTPQVPDFDADMDDATAVLEATATTFGRRTRYLKFQRDQMNAAIVALQNAPAVPSNVVVKNPAGGALQTVTGPIAATALTASGRGTFGEAQVNGAATVTGNETVGGALDVSGNIVGHADLKAANGNFAVKNLTTTDGLALWNGSAFRIASGNLELQGSSEVTYVGTARARLIDVPLCSGLGAADVSYDHFLDQWKVVTVSGGGVSADHRVLFPIRIPTGATLVNVDVFFRGVAGGAQNAAHLYVVIKNVSLDQIAYLTGTDSFGQPAESGQTKLGDAFVTVSDDTKYFRARIVANRVVTPAVETYYLAAFMANNVNARIGAVAYTFTDPGPRNY